MPSSCFVRRAGGGLLVVAVLLIFAVDVHSARAEITDRHRKLAEDVYRRLLAVVETPERWDAWPPEFTIEDSDVVNAYAGFETKDGKRIPFVVVCRGEIETGCQFDADALAGVLGHELSHLVLYHSLEKLEVREVHLKGKKVPLTVAALTRENELEADALGVKLALKAGFSQSGLKRNMINSRSVNRYCGIEGLGGTHPSADERILLFETDEEQRKLWRSMAAFNNGVFMLQTQQFEYAITFFRRVVEEFPQCYEGWANLGYAQLMLYCDALEADDLKSFELGHLVVGGFYDRPASMERSVRGILEEEWWAAIGSLREAIRLGATLKIKDPMVLAKANLAAAYLVAPYGKDLGQAERLFSEVLQLLDDPQVADQVDPLTQISILVNASAGRDVKERLETATKRLADLDQGKFAKATLSSLTAALNYHEASALMNSGDAQDQARALELFETYLKSTRKSSAWWPLAYGHYEELAKSLGRTAKPQAELKGLNSKKWRPTLSVDLSADEYVAIGDDTKAVLERLGKPDVVVPIVPGTNMNLYKYPQRGVSLLAATQVIAIFFDGAAAPPLSIKRPGVGEGSAKIQLGMPRSEFEKLLGDEWDGETGYLHDPDVAYRIYRDAGIAVRFQGGVVSEIAVILDTHA